MIEKPPYGLFVVGTDTGVGKTQVSCLILAELHCRGHRVGVYKPAQSGLVETAEGESDAARLWLAAGEPLTVDDVCPQSFAAPLAPHLAAQAEHRRLDRDLLRGGLAAWAGYGPSVLVEGAGGLLSPLGETETVADLACEFGYPLLVVADHRVGVINQVLLTLEAAGSRGLEVAGIVLNQTSAVDDVSRATNADQLSRWTEVPVWGEVGFGQRGWLESEPLSGWAEWLG